MVASERNHNLPDPTSPAAGTHFWLRCGAQIKPQRIEKSAIRRTAGSDSHLSMRSAPERNSNHTLMWRMFRSQAVGSSGCFGVVSGPVVAGVL